MGERAQRSGCLRPGGGVLSQTQVFGHQGCPEASFVVVAKNKRTETESTVIHKSLWSNMSKKLRKGHFFGYVAYCSY